MSFKSCILRFTSCILLLLFFILLSDTVFAQQPPGGRQQGGRPGANEIRVTQRDSGGKATKLSFFNVVNADIHDILKFMSDETNLTIIASDRVQGKITIVNLKDITIDEALEALKTALNTLNFTTIRVNRTIVIIPIDEAKTKPLRVQMGSDPEEIASSDEMITQIIPLKYADASEMAVNFKSLVPKNADIFADTNNNYLVITDTSSNIRRIATILKELDSQPSEMLKTQVFQLKYASAKNLEQTLSTLFRQGVDMARGLQKLSSRGMDEMMKRLDEARRSGQMPGRGIDFVKGQVLVASDERSNKLIITASEDNLEIISKMIQELDTSEVAQAEIKVFLLDYAIAEDVATQLETLLQGSETRRLPPWERWRARDMGITGTKGVQGSVSVVSDSRLNAVIVSSDPQNFPLIEDLIKQLDQQVAPQEVIKIFMLKLADAESVVQNMQDLFQGTSGRDMPWWERERRREERRRFGGSGDEVVGIQGTVNLVADTRLNAVIVSTAAANIPILEDLIKKLDVSVPDLTSDTRVYVLRNADSQDVADLLSNMYQSSRGGGMDRFFFLPRSSRQQSRTGAITGSISVSAYPRTNSVLVTSSSARNFEIVGKIIEELDQPTPDDLKYSTLIYPLEYSNADDMEQLLNNIFSEEGMESSRQRSSRDRSFFRMMMTGQATLQKDITTLAGQVRVTGDSQTNSLVITTPERNFEEVKNIIRQLDIVRGQVWIEIKLYELTLTGDTNLGLEWFWKEEKHLGKAGWTGEFGTAFQLDENGLGFTYKVFNKNLTALIHTLMKENRVNVLSMPSILTRDNQRAELSKGKDIPYLQGARTDQFGNVIYDYDFLQDIGVNIMLTPHIAKIRALKEGEKRTIGLDIERLNVSSFLEYTDFNAPLTSDSNVTTYVDVEDGEKIFIGGMISEEKKRVTHQIPILGSIPFIGRLFKRTQTIEEKTTLLIEITPHIIDISKEEDRVILKELQSKQTKETEKGMLDLPKE